MTPTSAPSTVCSRCGQKLPADAQFCDFCGAKVTAPGSEAAAEVIPEPAGIPVVETAPVGAAVTPADAKHAQKLLERADHALQRGDYHGAMVACRQSLALVPSAAGYLILAGITRGQGHVDEARQAIAKAQELAEPTNPLLPQIHLLAEQLNRPLNPNAMLTPSLPLTASLDSPVPPVVPEAAVYAPATEEAAAATPSFVSGAGMELDNSAPTPRSTPRTVIVYGAVVLLTFIAVFAIITATRPSQPPVSVEAPAVVEAPTVQTPLEGTPAPGTSPSTSAPAPSGVIQPPPFPGAGAVEPVGGAVASRQVAPQPATPGRRSAAPVYPQRNTVPPRRVSPRPRPEIPPASISPEAPVRRTNPASGDPDFPQLPPPNLGSSSGGTAVRVPSEGPTPAAVDSTQRPNTSTP